MNHPIRSEALASPPFKALLNQCVRCGLCLPACPTYAILNTEMDSPRGRIALMRAASEGRVGLAEPGAFREHMALCLSCRACEPACPSGVRYGILIETTRMAIEENRHRSTRERVLRWITLRELVPHRRRLRLLTNALRVYQASGLQLLVRRTGWLPKRLRALELLLPPLPSHYPDYRHPAPAIGERRGTVAFFRGCVQDAFLAEVNAATIRVLQRNGYQVHFPAGQTCCGAIHLHVGERDWASELARTNIDAFDGTEVEAVINNAGGCGAALKEYAHLFEKDPVYRERAVEFSARVKDLSEFLKEHLNRPPTGEVKTRATVVDSCHLRNVQRIVQPARDLLGAIPGLEVVELRQRDLCCGSAGVYNIVQADVANALLETKMRDIGASGGDTIVTTNTGCYLQLMRGVRDANSNARVVHLAELLDQSYATAESVC